ncbi:acetate kinase [Conyzicola nivalis]|uniref:Acetate kinase n=1 Tax=Conyzicola nivalis TaxID=1477021 RepID=A0ABV2QRL5_9MICO
MSLALIVNSGSSSLKYQLIELDGEETLASGSIDRIGEATSSVGHTTAGEKHEKQLPIADHTAALRVLTDAFAEYGPDLAFSPPVVIGHRVVHGGSLFTGPTLVTDRVIADIDELSALAPLHNPANLAGIRAAAVIFAGVPQVAVFDTAFHQTLPPEAFTYAIDRELAARHKIRRYGFHGTSHKYVSEQAAVFLDRPIESLKTIVLHLGNGASATAIDGGRSIDTSMGLTPLEGLVMGTRSGDLDPAIIFHLHRQAGLGFDELDSLLNRGSGLLGLTGTGDMRDVQNAAAGGDSDAEAALAVWRHRIRHYVGAYVAQLGGLDALVFTAGVGENNALLRRRALAGLEFLGIEIDNDRNELASREPRVISPEGARVAVLVIPTNEELEIARQALSVVAE